MGPQFKRETGKLGRVQRRATEGAGALEHARDEGDGGSWVVHLGKAVLVRRDLIVVFP